ncbi:MAG: hypothetical protein JWN88_1471 [Frankiales bacterium]|nr:hypothetical protein [Frankiales bacterium]
MLEPTQVADGGRDGRLTVHLVEAGAHDPSDNWLRRPADLPAKGF